jgi:hypothetical protein
MTSLLIVAPQSPRFQVKCASTRTWGSRPILASLPTSDRWGAIALLPFCERPLTSAGNSASDRLATFREGQGSILADTDN